MDRFLSEKVILGEIVPWGRTTLWRKVRAGEFPPPRALSEHRKAWLQSEVADWISTRPVANAYRSTEGSAIFGGPRAIGGIEAEIEAHNQACIDASRSGDSE